MEELLEGVEEEKLKLYAAKYLEQAASKRENYKKYLEKKTRIILNFGKKRLANQRAYYERNKEAQNAANMERYYANPEYKELKKPARTRGLS